MPEPEPGWQPPAVGIVPNAPHELGAVDVVVPVVVFEVVVVAPVVVFPLVLVPVWSQVDEPDWSHGAAVVVVEPVDRFVEVVVELVVAPPPVRYWLQEPEPFWSHELVVPDWFVVVVVVVPAPGTPGPPPGWLHDELEPGWLHELACFD